MKPASRLIAPAILFSATLAASGNDSFFAPYEHNHTSPLGTPIVHSFGVEPAFTGRDLFLDHTYIKGDGFTEHEAELELEWAFTKRLGVIVEVPYIWEDEDGADSVSGFGDIAIVPRALLIATDRFLLTAQAEIGLPTGSSTFGGDTSIAPGIAMWHDLGNHFTLNSAVAIAHGFDSDETELEFGIGLVKTFGAHQHQTGAKSHSDHGHPSAGLIHLHLELTGSTPVNGEDKGDFVTEGLIGITYGILPEMDIRLGYLFPISTPHEFDHGFTGGLVFHF